MTALKYEPSSQTPWLSPFLLIWALDGVLFADNMMLHAVCRTRMNFQPPYTMKGTISYAIAALVCGTIVTSCVPYDEYGRRIDTKKKPNRDLVKTDPKLREIEAKREELRKKEEQRRKELGLDAAENKPTESKPTTTDTREEAPPTMPKPPTTGPKNYPTAAPVPGKPGYVFSPYNNKVVDVREVGGSGKLVGDPNFPREEKKYFYIP
jgi:hypothetical protein